MKKIKVILIDAFKQSYLAYAPYLTSLTETYQWGELEMTPGHWGCIQILFEGSSNILALFKKGKKELSYLRYFTWLGYFGSAGRFLFDVIFNIPRYVKRYELIRTGNIPLSVIPSFSLSIQKHFAKKNGIDFQYFGELDRLGHIYGPDHDEIKKAVQRIDKKISTMEFDLIFSDHGMAAVNTLVSVPITKQCFIDSDMARYWGNDYELENIKQQLPFNHGKILPWDRSYGDLIFIANTGVLLFPNFWHTHPVKGMHGYDGKHPDMKAFYLIHRNGMKKNLKVNEPYDELRILRYG